MAKRKKDGMGFRQILKQKNNNLSVEQCRSQSSPQCRYLFIPARVGQTMCIKCLAHNDLLEAHPMIQLKPPEDDLTDDDSFVNQLW